ncbi:MAG: hypothetical protein AAGB33_00105 [Cellulomonas sp.]|nr:hypothetical protein [Rickettsiella sp.]
MLNNCVYTLELLNSVETDLKEVVEFSKDEGYEEDNFFEKHFQELDNLKTILFFDTIEQENIEWFFNSYLFDLIAAEPENFSVKLTDIYRLMIHDVKIVTNKDFNEQRQILLNKKNYRR